MDNNANLNVFMVEDNEIYSLMLEHKLRDISNYYINNYITAEECLENLDLNPDIIIMDYFLPNMTGLDALKEIKEKRPEIPVIVISSQKQLQVVVDVFKAGAFDYIVKNQDAVERIYNAINNILKQKKLKDENITLKLSLNKFKIASVLLIVIVLGLLVSILATV